MKGLLSAGLTIALLIPAYAPAQSAFDGTWKVDSSTGRMPNNPDVRRTVTFKTKGDTLSRVTKPSGESYTAKMNGTDAPSSGEPGITSVAVKMMDKNTLQETEKFNGKVVSVVKSRVAPDGKTVKVVDKDIRSGSTATFVAVKQ
jgi:hypothetical protein